MAAYRRVYDLRHLTAKNRDQLRNPTLRNRVWATFIFFYCCASVSVFYPPSIAEVDISPNPTICIWTEMRAFWLGGVLTRNCRRGGSEWAPRGPAIRLGNRYNAELSIAGGTRFA